MAIATTNFFRLMGGRIVLGRDFYDEDGIPQLRGARNRAAGAAACAAGCDSQL